MNFAIFLKRDLLDSNPKVKDLLSKYDNNICDGKYSKDEVKQLVSDSLNSWSIFLFGRKKIINIIFKELDNNIIGKKDNFIELSELDKYLQKEYKTMLSNIDNKSIKEACEYLNKIV